MTLKELRIKAGFSQQELSAKFEIPIDTIKSWDSGRRNPPEWAEKLLRKELEMEILKMEKNREK